MSWQYWLLIPTTLFHFVVSLRERKISPPGKLIDLGGYKVHLWVTFPAVKRQGLRDRWSKEREKLQWF